MKTATLILVTLLSLGRVGAQDVFVPGKKAAVRGATSGGANRAGVVFAPSKNAAVSVAARAHSGPKPDAIGLHSSYMPFQGPQPQRAVLQDPVVDRNLGLPVYLTFPERPYEIIGNVYVWGTPLPTDHDPRRQAVRTAVFYAKTRGCDAVCVVDLTRQPVLRNGYDEEAYMAAIVIKWTDKSP